MVTIKLRDKIETDYYGYVRLVNFYHEASKFTDQEIMICITDLDWIDANLSALLGAMLDKLKEENQLQFSMDYELAEKKFDVLLRNGFLNNKSSIKDVQKSTLPNNYFNLDDKHSYINYLEEWLVNHRGFPSQYKELKETLIYQLIEVFCNSHLHSASSYPFYVCGQYYPSKSCLIFTMVDLGDGFLPRINKVDNSITSYLQAILWAIKGNTSKLKLDEVPGGLGLKELIKYCSERKGGVQIISGDGFWSSDDAETIFSKGRTINDPFIGTVVNLFFKA